MQRKKSAPFFRVLPCLDLSLITFGSIYDHKSLYTAMHSFFSMHTLRILCVLYLVPPVLNAHGYMYQNACPPSPRGKQQHDNKIWFWIWWLCKTCIDIWHPFFIERNHVFPSCQQPGCCFTIRKKQPTARNPRHLKGEGWMAWFGWQHLVGLVVVSDIFNFHPDPLGRFPIWPTFFKWVGSTTN